MDLQRLTAQEIEKKTAELNNWIHQSPDFPESADMLFKMYPFEAFDRAKAFVDKVSEIAVGFGHYPGINFTVNYVQIILWTPELNGLTEKDFELAMEIDALDQLSMEKEKFQPTEN